MPRKNPYIVTFSLAFGAASGACTAQQWERYANDPPPGFEELWAAMNRLHEVMEEGPKEPSVGPNVQREPLIVTLDARGDYYVNYGENQRSPISSTVLERRVSALLRDRPGIGVVLRADERASSSDVVALRALLRQAGATDISSLDDTHARLLGAGRPEYIAQIKDKIERNWLRPPGIASGLKCAVRVSQIPGGEVVRAETQTSSGNSAFDRSVEEAVLRSSPLPVPKDPYAVRPEHRDHLPAAGVICDVQRRFHIVRRVRSGPDTRPLWRFGGVDIGCPAVSPGVDSHLVSPRSAGPVSAGRFRSRSTSNPISGFLPSFLRLSPREDLQRFAAMVVMPLGRRWPSELCLKDYESHLASFRQSVISSTLVQFEAISTRGEFDLADPTSLSLDG